MATARERERKKMNENANRNADSLCDNIWLTRKIDQCKYTM